MGSSIRSYLWPCCGVFHQIPTLAGVLTSSGEGYKGSEGLMLCLHLSCLFLLSASLPVYLLCVIADRHGNVCLFTVCLHVMHLHISVLVLGSVCLSVSTLCLFMYMSHTYTFPSAWSVCSCTFTLHTRIRVYPVTRCVRVTVGDFVAKAARGGLF